MDTRFTWQLEGRAFVFGDDIGIDGDLMPLEFALRRELRPEVLREHVFEQIDATLAKRIQPGDIVVGGRRFAQGNPHIQGLIGLAGAGVGLVVESIPSGSYRNAVSAGLRFLPKCPGVSAMVETGHELAVDFAEGTVRNLTTGETRWFEPLPKALRDIIAIGGWRESFRRRLAARQAATQLA